MRQNIVIILIILLHLSNLIESQELKYINFNNHNIQYYDIKDELVITFNSTLNINDRKKIIEKFSNVFINTNKVNLLGIDYNVILKLKKNIFLPQIIEQLHNELGITAINYPIYLKGSKYYLTNKIIIKCSKDNYSLVKESIINNYNSKLIKVLNIGNNNIKIVAEVDDKIGAIKLSNIFMESELKYNNIIENCFPNLIYELKIDKDQNQNNEKVLRNIEMNDLYPNDPGYSSQWWLRDLSSHGHINAPKAWGITTGNNSIVIAVLDPQGFDLEHPELNTKIIDPFNAVNPGILPTYEGNDYHGTACAGIIAALTNNLLGVAGLGWNIRVLPIKVAYNLENKYYATDEWWVNLESFIINRNDIYAFSCSWGIAWGSDCPDFYTSFEDSFLNMRDNIRNGKGACMVFCRGNDGKEEGWYPSCKDWPISVGATLIQGGWRNNSNFGGSLDITAPGTTIFTLDIHGPAGSRDDDYCYFYNTSASTPMIAGAIGLMASMNSHLDADDYEHILLKHGVVKQPGYNFYNNINHQHGTWNEYLGHGRLNLYDAIINVPKHDICITDNLIINNGENIFYNASNSITIPCYSNTFEIYNGGIVSMTSGNYILLKPGFSANQGSIVNCIIQNELVYHNNTKINYIPVDSTFLNYKTENKLIPKYFQLYQNYPNPFNPKTIITFDIPKDVHVEIKIYDLLGRNILTLLNNEFKSAGRHTIELNLLNYSSGIYFYKIIAGDYIMNRKMLLIK